MLGTVITYDRATRIGRIEAEDGAIYGFGRSQMVGRKPAFVGATVDLLVREAAAHEIVVINDSIDWTPRNTALFWLLLAAWLASIVLAGPGPTLSHKPSL